MAQRLDGTEIVSRAGQASQAKEIGSHFSLELELIIRSGKSALGRSHRSSVWKWDSCSLTAAHTISSGGFLVFGGSGPLPVSGPFSLPCAQGCRGRFPVPDHGASRLPSHSGCAQQLCVLCTISQLADEASLSRL